MRVQSKKSSGRSRRKKSKGDSAQSSPIPAIEEEPKGKPASGPEPSPQASSIVLELRKMKEQKKQEEEAATEKKKGKKKEARAEKRRKKKVQESIVVPTLVEKALVYIEQNHAEVDQACLTDDLTALQKKVFKILKDAVDCTFATVNLRLF